MMDPKLAAAIEEASRYPSPHNIQPASWRIEGGRIELWEDPTRWLSVGDHSGKDNEISLGMASRALEIALSAHGYQLSSMEWLPGFYPPSSVEPRLRATATLLRGEAIDPLHPFLAQRHSYRGKFAAASAQQIEAPNHLVHSHSIASVLNGERKSIADRHDRATVSLTENAEFNEELYRWIRFDLKDTKQSRDGLDYRCLGLSAPEAFFAKYLMSPRVLPILNKIGLAKLMLSEKASTLSATAIVAIHAPSDISLHEVGRRWMDFWLSLTASGLSGVPMSSLADDQAQHPWLRSLADIPSEHRIFGIMRIGPTPNDVPVSLRRSNSL